MFYGSSQLPTTAEHCFVVRTVHNDLITRYSAVVGSWGGAAEHFIDGSEKRICRLSFEFSSPHVIESRRSKAKKILVTEENQTLIDLSSNGGSLGQMETNNAYKHDIVKSPTWRRQTSWPITSVNYKYS